MKDQIFSLTTRISRPAAEVFAWHERPDALARLIPPWERVELIAATGGVQNGAQVTLRSKLGPCRLEWRLEHRDYVAGVQFRDVQLSGPFAKWEHVHRMLPDGPAACTLTDEIHYRLPGGNLGQALGGKFVTKQLARLFAWRHAATKTDLESTARYRPVVPRRVLMAGASGLIGQALEVFLRTQGHTVWRLVRRVPQADTEVFWNPAAGELAAAALEGIDAIINLSGENVGGGRWNPARRDAIRRSRVDATTTLVAAVTKLKRKPDVFVSASATGFYGSRGDDVLRESEPPGPGFLADVCREWEMAAERVAPLGVRLALVRFGLVLTPAGGALARLLPLFRAGLGGRMGSGKQWMSWISVDDVVGAIHHAMLEPQCRGSLNVVAPTPVTNAEFTATLGRALHRPTLLPVPAAVLRLIFGEMADATLLASSRAIPARLLASGYEFRHPTLNEAWLHLLG